MKTIYELNFSHLDIINKFIIEQKNDFLDFVKLGWNRKNIENQFKKKNNLSIGCFDEKKLCAFLIADKIINENLFDLDLHLMFVSKAERRKKYASKMLTFLEKNQKSLKIANIYLEVSTNNLGAINFYEKNNFVFYKFRHNYYCDNIKKSNAKCYFKKFKL